MIEKNKIEEIFFLTKEGGMFLLHIPYVEKYDDPALTSAFISAIGSFADMGVGKLETISRKRTDLLVLEGERVVLAAIVSKGIDLSYFRLEAKDLLDEFEETYKWQIREPDGLLNGYYKFALNVYMRFPIYDIQNNVVLERTNVPIENIPYNGVIRDGLTKLLEAVNGIRNIEEIHKASWHLIEPKKVTVLLGVGYHYGCFKLKQDFMAKKALLFVDRDIYGRVYPDYVLNDMLKTMNDAFGEDQMNMLLPLCDGTKTIEEVSEELKVEREVILFVVKGLIKLGVLVLIVKTDTPKQTTLEWIL